jgi:2-polyprenyl-3-methyl-5-hydroxy-6-metoxy-1,4-benzoquinol methylase
MDEKGLFYERFADRFDAAMNRYDLETRLGIVFDELLDADLAGKRLLDAGSGTGWFSAEACRRGADVTSLDVGERLLAEVAKKCASRRVVGDVLALPFGDASFDAVVCTEVIEHTVEPARAIAELARVLAPGGVLAITVPNRVWHAAIDLANVLGVRPYEGYENWVGWRELRGLLLAAGLEVERQRGFHLFPFVLPATHGLLRWADGLGDRIGPAMLNQGARARKPRR